MEGIRIIRDHVGFVPVNVFSFLNLFADFFYDFPLLLIISPWSEICSPRGSTENREIMKFSAIIPFDYLSSV